MNRLPLRIVSLRVSFLCSLALAFAIPTLMACGSGPSEPNDPGDGPGEEQPGVMALTVLFTTDERGQIEPGPASDGAAKLMGNWRAKENFDNNGDFLVLSGGGSWTMRPISTWFKGASVVDVMNAMGYDGMAIGASEFLIGGAGLAARNGEAGFPLLSSNLRLKNGGGVPGFATPFKVHNVNGIKVGLLGLTPTTTPQSNTPADTEAYDFLPYADALNEWVPQARGAGAKVVVVVAHLCYEDIVPLLPLAGQLGVTVFSGRYCGQTKAEVSNGVIVLVPDWGFSGYGKAVVRVKEKNKEIIELQAQVLPNTGGSPDEEVEARVGHWQGQMEAALSGVVGYVNEQLGRKSIALQNFVMDSWLAAYPADIAMNNSGSIRAGLGPGNITKGGVIGALPFENRLVEVELTGAQVVECLVDDFVLAGMTTQGGYFHPDGTALKMDSTYHVLTSDFLFGQANQRFKDFDQTAKATNILYSEATLIYLDALATSPDNPLDQFLDPNPRR